MDHVGDFNQEVMVSAVDVESCGREVDVSGIGGSPIGEEYQGLLDVKIDEESIGQDEMPETVPAATVGPCGDEPIIGQEFDSETAAHAFYNAYATRLGFIVRVSKLSRSRRDGSAIGRAFVCNREGFRMPDKREKVVRQRAETRVGCRAMILVRKADSGKWVVTKFVKEHTHALTPGKGRRDCIYDQYPVSSCATYC